MRARPFSSALVILLLAFSLPLSAEPAARYVRKALAAMGGAGAVDAVKTIETRGTLTRALGQAEPMTIPTHSILAFPDRFRQESTLPTGIALTTILTPDAAVIRLEQVDIPLSDADRAEIGRNLHRNPVHLLQRRDGIAKETGGTEMVEGRKAVLLTLGSGDDMTTLVVDAAKGDLLQIRFPAEAGKAGVKEPMTIRYGDFRAIGKLRYPFVSSGTVGGKEVFSSRLESVLVNGELGPDLWTVRPEEAQPAGPPAKAEDAPPKG